MHWDDMAWILCDKPIDGMDLQRFLLDRMSGRTLLFFPMHEVDWSLRTSNEIVIEYGASGHGDASNRVGGLRFAMELHEIDDGVESLGTIEALAREISIRFDCRTCCEASRVQLKDCPYYSLLFERGRVFLADDACLEETGDVVKLVELGYEPMSIDMTVFR